MQSDSTKKNQTSSGTVKVIILKYNDVFSEKKEEKFPYSVSLASNRETHKMTHVKRGNYQITDNLGMKRDFFIDEYKAILPPALYKLTIDGWSFEFSKFRLKSNTVERFEIPDNILIESSCLKNEMIVKTYSSEADLENISEKYTYHEVETDNITLPNSLNLIIRYCEKDEKESKTVYRGTITTYIGDVITAPKIILDEKLNRLTFYGIKEQPIILSFDGPNFEIVEFDLIKEKIIYKKQFRKEVIAHSPEND
ncbi:MAG: hypothetical protein M3405_17515 [Acidobacteriota bacterium]|jgi:hypothetical protein|nr:hypothetical protein [Acidobacteriota bacterium]